MEMEDDIWLIERIRAAPSIRLIIRLLGAPPPPFLPTTYPSSISVLLGIASRALDMLLLSQLRQYVICIDAAIWRKPTRFRADSNSNLLDIISEVLHGLAPCEERNDLFT
jgi:hypothetical protein